MTSGTFSGFLTCSAFYATPSTKLASTPLSSDPDVIRTCPLARPTDRPTATALPGYRRQSTDGRDGLEGEERERERERETRLSLARSLSTKDDTQTHDQ